MDRRAAVTELPSGLTIGVVAGEVALAADGGRAPEWVKITPRGTVTTRDGRTFSFDPEGLVARFNADGIDIPADLDHTISRRPIFGERADAIGWASQLQARADGTYGKVEWLEPGRAALAARTHRFVSPTFNHDDLGRATWLHSFSLVAAPALPMPALADANHQETPMSTKAIALALGLNEAATETACLSALTDLRGKADNPDPARFVKKDLHDQTLATLSATTQKLTETTSQLDAIKVAARKGDVETVIEGALKAKKIVPAQRDSLVAQCSSDEGFAQVKAFLAASPSSLQATGLDHAQPGSGDAAGRDPVALAAAAGKEQADQAAAGRRISVAEAMTIVERRTAS